MAENFLIYRSAMRLIFFFCLCLAATSCIRSGTSTATVADMPQPESFAEDTFLYYPIMDKRIAVDLKKTQKASIFDYFKHIELIPLETNENVLIGRLEKLIIHQNRFYIFDSHQLTVLVFDESGKFIFKVGKRGRGPGEFGDLDDVIINPYTGHLELLNPWGWIYSFYLNGNYIKTSNKITNRELLVVHRMIALNEKTYVFYSKYRQPFHVIYYDMEENKVLHQEYEEKHGNNFSDQLFYEYHDQWYFSRLWDNTTYQLGSNSLIKSYIFDFGKQNYNINKMEMHVEIRDPKNDPRRFAEQFPYQIHSQGQNNRYVMARIRQPRENRRLNIMYDKSSQECKIIERFDESVIFNPIMVTGEFVLCYCYHGELEEYVTEEMLDESNRKKLEAVMKVKHELNPVIIKYYFK